MCSRFVLACGLLALSACKVYDPSLLKGAIYAGHVDAGDRPDAAADSGEADSAVAADSGNFSDGGYDAAGEPECVATENPECPMRCRETCNGLDDDCDGNVDEAAVSESLCNLPSATAVCIDGKCLIASCDRAHFDCDGDPADGCEATLDSVENCGLCSQQCTLANATPACAEAACKIDACDELFGDCDKRADNGCERPLNTLSDCGACGARCSVAHGSSACDTGQCSFSQCEPGWGDCNHDASKLSVGDGCETELNTPDHCGACDTKCSGTTKPFCSGGKCTAIDCSMVSPGKADCDADGSSCEVDLNTLQNCGACGNACGAVANASLSCPSGMCQATCNAGFLSCDNSQSNGCETNIRTNTNCGACGVTCTYANASSSCSTGTCQLSACNSGYGNCNNSAADGCEQRLNTTTHCAACGKACALANATPTCSSGSCQVQSCNAGYGNCDGNAANGCETNLTNNAQNCNACGSACPSNFSCVSGKCVCTSDDDCGSGKSCCNGACVDRNSDEANCGSCGNQCGGGQTCCSGNCKNLSSDTNNCGSCGNRCGSNTNTCSNGSCKCANDNPCSGLAKCCSRGCEVVFVCF
jgi:hypothetical protein